MNAQDRAQYEEYLEEERQRRKQASEKFDEVYRNPGISRETLLIACLIAGLMATIAAGFLWAVFFLPFGK
jgi:hypothetical protein